MTLIFRTILIHFIFLLILMPFVAKASIYTVYEKIDGDVTRLQRDVLRVRWKDKVGGDLYIYKNYDRIALVTPFQLFLALKNLKFFGSILKEYFRLKGRSIKFIDFDFTTAYITPWSCLVTVVAMYRILDPQHLFHSNDSLLPIAVLYSFYRGCISGRVSNILIKRGENNGVWLLSSLLAFVPGVDLFSELSLRVTRAEFLLSKHKHMPVYFETFKAYEAMLRSLPNKMK